MLWDLDGEIRNAGGGWRGTGAQLLTVFGRAAADISCSVHTQSIMLSNRSTKILLMRRQSAVQWLRLKPCQAVLSGFVCFRLCQLVKCLRSLTKTY